jgi:hypothetical protein
LCGFVEVGPLDAAISGECDLTAHVVNVGGVDDAVACAITGTRRACGASAWVYD